MDLSAGKFWGLRRLADESGRWKMVAIDQRKPLMDPIARIRGVAEAPYEDLAAIKEILAKHLAPPSSAMLLDPGYAYSGAIAHVPARRGLIMTLEEWQTADTPGGKMSRDIPEWGVGKIRRLGADAVKLLVWYRHDAAESVRAHQQAWVRAAGEACARHDIVFLLEILVYPLPGEEPARFVAQRTGLVHQAVRDFLDPAFGVDIYKLEPPASITGVPDPAGPQAARLQDSYDRMAAMLPRPWVLLSAGAGPADFIRSLTYAYRANASGYLCGRAIWHDAFEHFPDLVALEKAVVAGSVPYMAELNALTDRAALKWTDHPAWQGRLGLADAGPNFPARYRDA